MGLGTIRLQFGDDICYEFDADRSQFDQLLAEWSKLGQRRAQIRETSGTESVVDLSGLLIAVFVPKADE